ncbi:C-type lectin domain family 2 member D-like [Mauremys mutica]|uniref:C-type lectin domain family 2 member D-like n=1 Tax=Mauremys mutica TaxID=74926 RepID=UPI001D16087F|nr:C-type lectin domain family 2 member D-like [Mauremys mutica]
MGPATGAAESEESLQELRVDGDGHQETGGEPEPPRNCKKCNYYKKGSVALTAMVLVLTGAAVVLAVLLSGRSSAALGPACPDGWIGYRGKCYYFSEAEGNWNNSQSQCSSLSASLAAIDTLQNLAFVLRYKGKLDRWVGLRKDPGQPWKWVNGTEFNHLSPVRGGGDCAYLTDQGGVSSLRCTSERYWICNKRDAFTEAKEAATERGS